MFSENNQISGRQLNRMLVLDLFAASSMILPRLLPRICGRQGVYAILAAAVFMLAGAAVYMRTAFCCEDNFYNFAKRQTGSVPAALMVLFFMVKFLLSAVFILKMFSEVIGRTFLTQMPERVIAALIILTALYNVSRGMETRGRLSELLMWIVLVPIMFIVFLAAFEIKGSRIFPMEISRPGEIASAGLLCAAVFNVFEFLLFAVPYVRHECFKRTYKYAAGAVVTAALCVIFIYIACIGVFSANGAAAEYWPSVTLMQVIRLPGRFISRQDGLVLAVWMGAIFILLSGYIFYTDELTKQLFPKKYFKGTMIGWLILVYGLFWAIKDYGAFEKFYWQTMAFWGMPISLLIAFWLLAGQRYKRRLSDEKNS